MADIFFQPAAAIVSSMPATELPPLFSTAICRRQLLRRRCGYADITPLLHYAVSDIR
jgi:hypothetical protein